VSASTDRERTAERINLIVKNPDKLNDLVELLGGSAKGVTKAEVIRNAMDLYYLLVKRMKTGRRLYLADGNPTEKGTNVTEVALPELE
jgi:hypothetical protein